MTCSPRMRLERILVKLTEVQYEVGELRQTLGTGADTSQADDAIERCRLMVLHLERWKDFKQG